MLIDDTNFKILEDLLNILNNKEHISLYEVGIRDILEVVVNNNYSFIKEILEDYK